MIRLLERSKYNIFGFEVSGEVSEADFQDVTALLEEALKEFEKINWLFVLKTEKYENPLVIYEIMAWGLKNILNFDRMAVVGDKLWEQLLIESDSYLFGDQYYDISQLEEAWEYVEGATKLMY